MPIETVAGSRARFCCSACAEGLRTDRRYGLIYPSYRVEMEDGTWKIMGVEEASLACDFCAYCSADLSDE